jgi:hypothetical protein
VPMRNLVLMEMYRNLLVTNFGVVSKHSHISVRHYLPVFRDAY